jgi:hypothetical protein
MMIGFLIKKCFFDLWDNLFKLVLINLGFIASLAIPVFIPPLFMGLPAVGTGVLVIGCVWCCIYLSTAALTLKSLSDYGSFGFSDFARNLKTAWPAGLISGGFVFLGYFLCAVVIPFYFSMGSMAGLLLTAVVFWTLAVGVLAFQFFFAVCFRLGAINNPEGRSFKGKKLTSVIKKCFIIFFDNPMFCIFSFLHNLVVLLISALVAFLVPGPAGALLFLDEGLRLRLLKYDWLEANPGDNRRKIPWDALLIDEREKTGTRSLKNFIFPWKD